MNGYQCKTTTTAIIKALEEHKANHIKNYKTAVTNYKTAAEKTLTKMLENIKNGKRISHNISLYAPVNYAKEYDRMINMFKRTLERTITLTEEQYNQIFCDKWHWANSFNTNTMVYLRGAPGITGPTGVQGCTGGTGTMGFSGAEEEDNCDGEDLIPKDLK
jgi:hypothetical protein